MSSATQSQTSEVQVCLSTLGAPVNGKLGDIMRECARKYVTYNSCLIIGDLQQN